MEYGEQSKAKVMASVTSGNIKNQQQQEQGFAANKCSSCCSCPCGNNNGYGGGGNNNGYGGSNNNGYGGCSSNNNGYLDSSSFPPGYRFCPLDYELIVHYLDKKVKNMPLPLNNIRDVNLYNRHPDDLTEEYQVLGEKEWYFFTPRERKYKNGNRPNRAAGNGYWKATGADKNIKDEDGEIVGQRKALVFYEGKPPKGEKTNWIMHEYGVKDPPRSKRDPDDMRLDEWVLCRIYKKTNKFNQARRRDKEPDSLSNEGSPPDAMKNVSNQVECSNGGDYLYPFQMNPIQMKLPEIPLPHFDAASSVFNGHLHPGLNYGGIQPISFRPPVYSGTDDKAYDRGSTRVTGIADNNAFMFNYQQKEEDAWGSKPVTGIADNNAFASNHMREDVWDGSKLARGIQDDIWGIQNQDNCDLYSQINFSNYINPNLESIFPNHLPKSPSMPPPNDE